jgi:methionyl-tRNA formyltransferase
VHSVFVYPAPGTLCERALRTVADCGLLHAGTPADADVAIAPLLRRKLSHCECHAPALGTLIFHPSLLPRHRGPDAIKWAVLAGEPFTGVTWFWADDGLDAGDLCEQELLAIPAGITPRAFYDVHVIPAALRTLERALIGISLGHPRRIPQPHDAATYESFYPRPKTAAAEVSHVEVVAVR